MVARLWLVPGGEGCHAQTLSLVSGAPLPALGMGKGRLPAALSSLQRGALLCIAAQEPSSPRPSEGREPFSAQLILWMISC